MDLTNLSQLHSTDEITIETIEPNVGASWDAQAWDDIFTTVDIETNEEVITS
jgi:hypothetical protein